MENLINQQFIEDTINKEIEELKKQKEKELKEIGGTFGAYSFNIVVAIDFVIEHLEKIKNKIIS